MSLSDVAHVAGGVRAEVGKAFVGHENVVDLLLIALLARGHVLLEGPPGVAKTLLARAFAASLDLAFGRVQFTPDLMPGDVVGTSVFHFQANEFRLVQGPVFTELLLADEINRTPPKTQAALLEAMHEGAVTIDGQTLALSPFFMTVATQNPIEHQGTYPLPEAQLDRFLFKAIVGYPTEAEEIEIVARHGARGFGRFDELELSAHASKDAIVAARAGVDAVTVSQPVAAYVVALVRETRRHPNLDYGASPRAAAMLARAARAAAALAGRDYVIPDDVKALTPHLLRHRLVLAAAAEMEGLAADDVIAEVLASVEPPK